MGRLKKDEMEVDAGVPQAESAEMKSPKRWWYVENLKKLKIIFVRRCQSVRKKRRSSRLCRVLSASREERFTSATIAAATKRSDTGNLLQWPLKKVKKLEQEISVSSASMSGRYSNRG